jgi:hypothetical protein
MLRILREIDQVPSAEFATHVCRLDSHHQYLDIQWQSNLNAEL